MVNPSEYLSSEKSIFLPKISTSIKIYQNTSKYHVFLNYTKDSIFDDIKQHETKYNTRYRHIHQTEFFALNTTGST